MRINITIGLGIGAIVLQLAILYVHFTGSKGVSQAASAIITLRPGENVTATIVATDIKPELVGKSVKMTFTIEEEK